jgi:endoglucanase
MSRSAIVNAFRSILSAFFIGILLLAVYPQDASAASAVQLRGRVKLYGKVQVGKRGTYYAAPTLANISSGTPGPVSASVTWKTNVPATTQVLYGFTAAYGLSTTSASLTGAHTMIITGLNASTTYHYAVVSTDGNGHTTTSADRAFTTSSWPGIGFNAGGQGYYFNNFTFLSSADLAYMATQGVPTVRVPICWEQMQQALNGSLDASYLSALTSFMSTAASYNIKVIVDIHGYARYQSTGSTDIGGNLIGDPTKCLANSTGYLIGSAQVSTSTFGNLWGQLATALQGQPGLGGYELMNEPHDLANLAIWPAAAQNAITAIRQVDTVTPIYVDGNQWASVLFATYDASFPLSDPNNKLIYAAHIYFDSDGSGTYVTTYDQSAAYPTMVVSKLSPFVTWLQQTNQKGAVTEVGVPYSNLQWIPVLQNAMSYLYSKNMLGIVHYYDTNQPGTASYWPLQNGLGVQYVNAAPINAAGKLVATSTTPLMTAVRQIDLGH